MSAEKLNRACWTETPRALWPWDLDCKFAVGLEMATGHRAPGAG